MLRGDRKGLLRSARNDGTSKIISRWEVGGCFALLAMTFPVIGMRDGS